jgi:transposase
MPAIAIALKDGMSADAFRAAAASAKDANQARRLLAFAAVRDGMTRDAAARIGGMTRQTLRDWVHAFNERGIDGLINATAPGRPSKLSDEQKLELKTLALTPPDPAIDGLVRWRRIDLAQAAKARFGVDVDPDTIGRMLRQLGLSHISARPRYPAQPDDAVVSFQKRSQTN